MIKNKQIHNILKDHEKRIVALERIMGTYKIQKSGKTKKSLSGYIKNLRDNGFFSQPKTAAETHTKLHGSYHCELNRVAVALMRLADRKQLRKAAKSLAGKKYRAYVW